ncbi:MAG: hypothetical protein ACK5JM_05775 [Rhodoblastus sp.]
MIQRRKIMIWRKVKSLRLVKMAAGFPVREPAIRGAAFERSHSLSRSYMNVTILYGCDHKTDRQSGNAGPSAIEQGRHDALRALF